MSIFIETTAREQHRVVHISTAANLVQMHAGETNTYLEHFHRLIYYRQDWDRATTQHWDRATTPHFDRATTQHWDRATTQHWDRATTPHLDRATTQHWDRATTPHLDRATTSTTHNTHFYSMLMSCPFCSLPTVLS